jgi:HK97 family phage major capsid protein
MKNAKQLREERQSKIDQATALFDKAKGEGRTVLNPEEKTQYDALIREIDELAVDVTRAENQERLNAELAGRRAPISGGGSAEKRNLAKFSLRKMVLDVLEGRPQTGLEAEMSQEAVNEARGLGLTLEGRAHIPSFLAFGTRDNSVTMPTQPEDGSAVVYDDPAQPIIGLLRPELAIERLGARVLRGLRGEVPFGAMTQGAVASWKPEVALLDKSNIKFRNTTMKPHRMGTYIDVSKQFLIQTTPDVEAMMREDLQQAMDQLLDVTALYGTGQPSDNQPLGLLNTPGVYVISGGTNGRQPTFADIIALEASPEIRNTGSGKTGYLMNSKIKGTLKNTQVVSGQAMMVVMDNATLNGHNLVVSNIVKDQTRGTATQASAIAYGDWRQLILGQWGGLDLTVDNLTLALNGQNRIIVQSWWDIFTRRPECFAALVGAIPSAEILALTPQ